MMGRANLAKESDAQLLRRFADERDECAFAWLVSRHAKVVLSACYRVLRNRQDAEDAFQAVMLTMATKSRSLKNVRSLSAWLHGVSVRTSLNLHRMNRKWQRAVENGHGTAKETYEDNDQSGELSRWLDEDVIIQLDAIGNTVSGWAWRASEEMPEMPLISRVLDQTWEGAPGVWYAAPQSPQLGTAGTVIYRYVHVASESIPEPSTATLCGIAFLAILGIRRWPRLSRP